MLQQTQVDRVIPKYHEFLRRYPTLKALARARVSELRKVWYPLGYNIRPIRLRNIARRVVTHHAGRIPNSYEGLLAMDGVGRYTAGAVLSFAFNQDAPILDTNVERLLRRYFGLDRTRNGSLGRRQLWELARAVIPPGQAYQINQAMMDFGALICTARRPKCPTCALRRSCRSYPYEQTRATRAGRRGSH
jgi:A/G-specific adenine glycosylase